MFDCLELPTNIFVANGIWKTIDRDVFSIYFVFLEIVCVYKSFNYFLQTASKSVFKAVYKPSF